MKNTTLLRDGEIYTRVNKTKAKKLYNEGYNILVMPCNYGQLNNLWTIDVEINNRSNKDFNNVINEFIYYNCNNEVGKYPNFYINEKFLK